MAAGDRLDYERGRTGAWYPAEILELRERLRAALAAVVSVPPATLALTRSTTEGCSIVCAGLGLGPGDEVVTTDVEHFGLLGPLAASGATRPRREAARAPAGGGARRDRGRGRPRDEADRDLRTSPGRPGTCCRVRELAGLGVPVLADGAQSVGAVPVAAAETGAAFYAFSGQKWLLGPRRHRRPRASRPSGSSGSRGRAPSYYAQDGYDEAGAFTPKAGAARFDCGWLDRAQLEGSLASLAFLDEVGPGALRARARAGRARPQLIAAHVELVTAAGPGDARHAGRAPTPPPSRAGSPSRA